MPRELYNANITHVSYVDKGANQKQFFFTKSDEQPDFKKEVDLFINKEDEEQKLVYGVVYEPDVEDSHGDVMSASEIEKAAHGFVKDARNIDKQHNFESGVGEVAESYIAPADFDIGGNSIKKGSWVLVTKASDEVWEDIKKGEITGYSMAGKAETLEKQNSNPKQSPESSSNDEEFKGFFDVLKSFFTKGEMRDNYEGDQKRRNLWSAFDGLEDIFFTSMFDNPTADVTDFERLLTGAEEFVEILQEIKSNGDIEKAMKDKPATITKAGKKISSANMKKIQSARDNLEEIIDQQEEEKEEEEEDDVKKEDIEKLLDEKINPITKRLDAVEKEEGGEGNPSGTEDKEAELMKQFTDALDEKMDPITKRLETVEKARGVSNQVDPSEGGQGTQQSEVQKGYMRHFG